MVLLADEVKQGDYDAVLARFEAGRGIGALADGLIAAWAYLGQGDMAAALAQFDAVADERGLRGFAIYHKALALASVGRFRGRRADFRRGVRRADAAHPAGHHRLGRDAQPAGRNDEAVALIDETFGTDLDPESASAGAPGGGRAAALHPRVRRGRRRGRGVLFAGAGAGVDTSADYVLLYSRGSPSISSPGHVDARMMSAELLESLERYDLAIEAYKTVPADHPGQPAELGRAEALRRAGKDRRRHRGAGTAGRASIRTCPSVHVSAGDLYRQLKRFEEAAAAYDKALALYAERENRPVVRALRARHQP